MRCRRVDVTHRTSWLGHVPARPEDFLALVVVAFITIFGMVVMFNATRADWGPIGGALLALFVPL